MKNIFNNKVTKVVGGCAAAGSAGCGGYYLLSRVGEINHRLYMDPGRQEYYTGAQQRLARKGKRFIGQISANKYDFYKDFNFPGECITKLFPGTETSPIFEWNSYKNDVVTDVTEKKIFNGSNQTNPPELACYTYSDDIKQDKFRIDLAVRRKNEGWVWMSGIRPELVKEKENDKEKEVAKDKLWFREIYLTTKDNKKWTADLAQEGEILDKDNAYKITLPYDWKPEGIYWDIDPDTGDPCFFACNGNTKISKSFYWIPKANSQKALKDLSSNMDRQITRFAYDNSHEAYIHQNRKMIFKDNVWRPYVIPEKQQSKALFKLEDSSIAEIKGVWRDLNGLCFQRMRKESETKAFSVFCK